MTRDEKTQAEVMPAMPRRDAFLRIAFIYCVVQITSYLVLQRACSPFVVADVWIHGALGPFAIVKALPRFQYHSVLANAGFVLVCLIVLFTPLAYVVRPGRLTLVVSAIGLMVWCVYGLGFSIDHM